MVLQSSLISSVLLLWHSIVVEFCFLLWVIMVFTMVINSGIDSVRRYGNF